MNIEQKNACRIALWTLTACVFLCIPFLKNPTLFDDFNIITPSNLQRLQNLGLELAPRAWVYQTFLINRYLSGFNLESYRIVNLALHLATSLALFFLCKEAIIQSTPSVARSRAEPNFNAALISALFALHPIAIFTQAYLAQRTILASTLAALCSTLFFMRGLRGNKAYLYVSAFLCAVSLYSKEHSIALPAVLSLLLVAELTNTQKNKQNFLQTHVHAVIALTLCYLTSLLLLLGLKGIIGSNYEPLTLEMIENTPLLEGKNLYLLSSLNQAKLFFSYLSEWLLPFPDRISIDIRKPFPTEIATIGNLLPAALFVALNAFIIKKAMTGNSKTFYTLLAAPGILFLTELSVTRIQENFVLYRSYLWAPFGFAAIGIAITNVKSTKIKVLTFILAYTLMLYSSCVVLVSLSNPYLAWDAARKIYEENNKEPFVPGGYRIYYNLGTTLYDHKNLELALENYNKSLNLNNQYSYALMNRGIIFLDIQQWGPALEDFEKAYLLAGKSSVKPLIGKAKALKKLGREAELEKTLNELCALSNPSTCRETKTFVDTK